MKINHLEITCFRNFEHASITFSPRINIFHGLNGSGKTSFLEAIHYLGLGRSFRTRNLSRIIHHSHDRFSLFSQLMQPSGIHLPIGIERNKKTSQTTIKIGGKVAHSLIELAELLPIQLINADSHQLLSTGPLTRRQFLDWGVFHVEPSFYSYWQRATRIIRQRNACLKTAKSYQDIASWDEELAACAAKINEYRTQYTELITPLLQEMLQFLLPQFTFKLHYSPGWNTGVPFAEVLRDNFNKDRQFGYTINGPHRADLQLKINHVLAFETLSQGQQKLAAYALRLAQGKLLITQYAKNCIFLIDDLPSELDKDKRTAISQLLVTLEAQLFITGINAEDLTNLTAAPNSKTFHVEHGKITPTPRI